MARVCIHYEHRDYSGLLADLQSTNALLGRPGEPGDTEEFDRASRRKPIDALRNCLSNLQLDPDELLGIPPPELSQARYSITGKSGTAENEDRASVRGAHGTLMFMEDKNNEANRNRADVAGLST